MKNALAATRAALTWLVVTASLVTAGLVLAVPADAAAKTYTASAPAPVHASPAATSAVLGTLAKGNHVLPTAAAKGGWLPITYAATRGYVATSAVKVDKKAAASVTTGAAGKKAATLTVNVRAAASLNANIVAVVKKAAVLKVTGVTSGTFTQVTHAAKPSWVYSEFLTASTDTTPDVVASYTTIASLALRETAAVTAKNRGTIKTGTKVGGTGTHSGSYSQVVYKGKVGWVITGYLKAVKGTPAALVLPIRKSTRYAMTADTVIRAAAAASEQVAKLAAAEAVRTTGKTKADFTEIIWNGATKWVATIALSVTQPSADGFIDLGSSSLNKLEPNGKAAVIALRAAFPKIKTIYGWRSSSAYSGDHPNGRATDNMIPDYKKNKALGDAVAAWVIAHGKELHISYLIWRQRSYTLSRGTWKSMADRGGDTANHMDHVHISFEPS